MSGAARVLVQLIHRNCPRRMHASLRHRSDWRARIARNLWFSASRDVGGTGATGTSRAGGCLMTSKVLAALDFGEPSLEALGQARELAHGLGGTLAVCHVLPAVRDLSLLFPQGGVIVEADQIAEVEQTRKALAERARTELGLELTEVFVDRGKPYAEIVRRG